ncbi:reverse transcriptase family protein, partial [Klebsiella pneumoniae]|nr:reverse transcriptase family protein [Klebsiella pneumoniae]
REANVVPLFKKGNKNNPGNYRPVSLTSVVGKVMEKVLKDRIAEHLERHCLIRDSQHGFVKGRSCLTSLIAFFEEVTKQVDEGKPVDVVYMDFSKAFDKVPHGRLMEKVRRHGIVGNVASWIKNWLTDRRQRVVLDGKYSAWSPVTSGVPQGSVLGPLLFVIFINDLDMEVEGWVSKFADDTKIGGIVDTEEGCCGLQRDLDRLQSWAEKWQMEFNPEKCEVVHFGRTNKNAKYWVNGRVLGSVEEQRDLGVYVHRSLKVATQVDRAVKKAYGVLAFINRGIEFKSREVMMQLYRTLVRPHLEYCVQFWSPHFRKDVEALERVQRRFTRMLPGMENRSYEERLSVLGLFSLERRRMRGDLIEVYKMIRGIDRVDSQRLFPQVEQSVTRGHKFKVKGGRYRGDVRGRFFTQRVVGAWNALPGEVVGSETLGTFKRLLDRYMDKGRMMGYRLNCP